MFEHMCTKYMIHTYVAVVPCQAEGCTQFPWRQNSEELHVDSSEMFWLSKFTVAKSDLDLSEIGRQKRGKKTVSRAAMEAQSV